MKILWILVIVLAIVVVILGVLLAGQKERVNVAAEEAAIRALPTEWANAANDKDVERMAALYTEDASLLPPNAPIVTGKGAIRDMWSELLERPGFSCQIELTDLAVSRVGDVAHSLGTYELTTNDPEGNPMTERGKWLVAMEKQADGAWKIVAHAWNTDQPPMTAPTS